MSGFVYGGKFEKHINHLYSPKNHETAKKFKEHEKKHGLYSFGDSFTKALVPKAENWADETGSTKHVRTFAHKGHLHIGLHMLCPNTSLK